MTEIVRDLQRAAHLVKLIGELRLPTGRSISEALTVRSIPYWDVFSVELSRIYLPPQFSSSRSSNIFENTLRPNLIRAKYFIRDIFRYKKDPVVRVGHRSTGPILCLDFSDHISRDVLQPVVRYLRNSKDSSTREVICLRDRTWASSFIEGVSYLVTGSFWDLEVSKNVHFARKQLSLAVREVIASKALVSLVEGTEKGLWHRIQPALQRFITGELSALTRLGELSRVILRHLNPSLVVVGDIADPRTRIFALQCKSLGIPCLALQFGMVGPASIEWQFFPADIVASWGDDSSNMLRYHGIDETKIIPTGSPRNDMLFDYDRSELTSLRYKHGVPNDASVVLLASTFQLESYNKYSNPEILRDMKKAIFSAASKFTNLYLIVKPHPSEDSNETRNLAPTCENIIFLSGNLDIRDYLRICDSFISFGSTATVDALLLNLYVVCPVYPGWVWSKLFVDTGAVHSPSSEKEIYEFFQTISDGTYKKKLSDLKPQRDRLVKRWIFREDGGASQRIGNLGLKMVKCISDN